MVSELPAVVAATHYHGIFSRVVRHGRMGDVKTARQILRTGTFDIEKVEFLTHIRDMSAYEYNSVQQGFEQLNYPGGTARNFDRVFVLNTSDPFVLSFGSYLVVDQETLKEGYEGGYISHIIAHELAHLNNGDSYVKAAFWFLGKGWVQEFMSPDGIKPRDRDRELEEFNRITHNATYSALTGMRVGGWWGLLIALGIVVGTKVVNDKGKGVQAFDKEITEFFHEWDLEADALAEQWVGANQYRSYLWSLLENDIARPFDASARVRFDASEDRGDPTPRLEVAEELPAPAYAPVPTSTGTDVAGGLRMLFYVVFFGGLFIGACIIWARIADMLLGN